MDLTASLKRFNSFLTMLHKWSGKNQKSSNAQTTQARQFFNSSPWRELMKLLNYCFHVVHRQTNGQFILLADLHMNEQLKSFSQLAPYQTVSHALGS